MHTLTQHEGVVDGATNAVGKQEDPEPWQVLHYEQRQHLEGHQAQHPPLQVGIIAKKFLDLRMFFCGYIKVLCPVLSALVYVSLYTLPIAA